MRRIIAAVVLVTALSAGVFTGCGGAVSTQDSGVESQSQESAAADSGQSPQPDAADLDETPETEENEYILLLRENDDFARPDSAPATFRCDSSAPELAELSAAYNLPEVAGDGDAQTKAINLLAFLSANVCHYGNYDNHVERNALALLDYAFQKGEENGINCMALSITLTEMLLSQGIPARTVWLMPGGPEDFDNHVATIAYIEERGRYIFLDPTYNAYFTDDSGEVLSIQALRDAMVKGGSVNVNEDAHYNGNVLSPEDHEGYLHYLAKDFFYFYSYATEGYGSPGRAPVYLCPAGFDVIEWEIANLEFRNASEYNPEPLSEEELEAQRQQMRETAIHYTTPEDFWAKPAA